MTLDWNWFFAAFAQCAAALIAIIGAFIISKLLGESEKEEKYANKIDDLIIQYNDLVKRISARYFDWYDKQNIEYSDIIKDAINNNDFEELSDNEMMAKLLELEPKLFGTLDGLEKLKERIEKLKPKASSYEGVTVVLPSLSINIPSKGLWNSLSNEKEIINQLEIESETLIEKFSKTASDLSATKQNLEPIKTTIYILAIGLILTVIYPLHFMPIEVNKTPQLGFSFDIVLAHLISLKGILLMLLTIVIEGIFGYFLWLINRTEKRYNHTSSKLEDKYYDISTYSEYFD